MAQPKIIVIGAGICGVSTAIWLQRYGYQVILMDRGEPGMGASYGNAGLIAQWAVVPMTTPALWGNLPSLLFNPKSTFSLKWGYMPRLVPWLAKFLSQATDARARQTVSHLMPLLSDAVDQHKALSSGTPVAQWVVDSKISYVYRSQAGFEQDAYSWALRREVGLVPTILTGAQVAEEEPILGPTMQCMAVLEGQGHILNPGQYVKELCAYFVHGGGTFIQAEVQDFKKSNGKITAIHTDQGEFECDNAVVTSGIWSKPLMKRLGLSVPLEAERGYHVVYKNASILPKNPMLAAGKFGITPMGGNLRCAGTVELGGIEYGPSKRPIALIKSFVKDAFPELHYDGTEEWMGFRPSTTDSLPLIGQIAQSGIYTAFGHQHIGLTSGPKSGRMIADMIDGRVSNSDTSAFDPARFM